MVDEVVGPFEGGNKEMFAKCLHELGYEHIQPELVQLLTELARAGVEPAPSSLGPRRSQIH